MIQLSVAVRNARLAAIESTIGTAPKLQLRSGPQPTNITEPDSGTLIAEFDLPSDWISAPSNGSSSFLGVPVSVTADDAGTIGHFRVKNTAGSTTHAQGSVTLAGGGGDLIADNLAVNAGQTVQITGITINEGNA
ncbi:hypothetical protein [Microcystis phage Mwe-JY26]